jgi:hypothetical protein
VVVVDEIDGIFLILLLGSAVLAVTVLLGIVW